jgi:uncharacterized protein YcfJ
MQSVSDCPGVDVSIRACLSWFSLCLLFAFPPLSAQVREPAQNENINIYVDYARVLGVEPVYANASGLYNEKICDDASRHAGKPEQPAQGHLSRMWASVKGWFSDEEAKTETAASATARSNLHCRDTLMPKDGQKPVAYDVDYMYKGQKYRARLPEDPGDRLRICICIAPYPPGSDTQLRCNGAQTP